MLYHRLHLIVIERQIQNLDICLIYTCYFANAKCSKIPIILHSNNFSKYATLKNGTHGLISMRELMEKQDGISESWLVLEYLGHRVAL